MASLRAKMNAAIQYSATSKLLGLMPRTTQLHSPWFLATPIRTFNLEVTDVPQDGFPVWMPLTSDR